MVSYFELRPPLTKTGPARTQHLFCGCHRSTRALSSPTSPAAASSHWKSGKIKGTAIGQADIHPSHRNPCIQHNHENKQLLDGAYFEIGMPLTEVEPACTWNLFCGRGRHRSTKGLVSPHLLSLPLSGKMAKLKGQQSVEQRSTPCLNHENTRLLDGTYLEIRLPLTKTDPARTWHLFRTRQRSTIGLTSPRLLSVPPSGKIA